MRKTAVKMLILGVAVLTLFNTAMGIKSNGYAKAREVDLQMLNGQVEDWFKETRAALEAAGVPHSDSKPEDKNAGALGESVSVPAARGVSVGPWLVIILAMAGGASLLFVAFSKQYQPAGREATVQQMVDKIVAKNTGRVQNVRQRMSQHRTKRNMKQDDFDDISRAVDEIVAKYQRED